MKWPKKPNVKKNFFPEENRISLYLRVENNFLISTQKQYTSKKNDKL